MRPFLSAGIKGKSIEPAVYYTGRHSNKRIGTFPDASGVMLPLIASTANGKDSKQVIRFKNALYMFLGQTLWRLTEGRTQWESIWVSPNQSPDRWIMGPFYYIDSGTPVIAWMDYGSDSIWRLRTYDGQSVKTGPGKTSGSVLVTHDSTTKDFRFGNHIGAIYQEGSNAIVGSLATSGIVHAYHTTGPSFFGAELCTYKNQPMFISQTDGTSTVFGIYILGQWQILAAQYTDTIGGASYFNTIQHSFFHGKDNESLWLVYGTQASGIRIKKGIESAPNYNSSFSFTDYDWGIYGNSQPSGANYAIAVGSYYDRYSIKSNKTRYNPENLTDVREDIFINSENAGNCSAFSLDILNPDNATAFTHHTALGGYNSVHTFPYDKLGEGAYQFDGNWAYIQIENFAEGNGYGRSQISFRLYESQTFPVGTRAKVAFLYAFGEGYPNRYLTVSNPSHGTMEGSYNDGLTFNSGILYTVDVEAVPNSLNDNDVITIIPVASGTL